MSTKINIEELKALIANSIKEENLQNALPEDAVEKIKNKIISIKNKESAKEIPDIVSEVDHSSLSLDNKFPKEDEEYEENIQIPEYINNQNETSDNKDMFIQPGSEPLNKTFEPKMGYTPVLPEILKNTEPAELFVFKSSDLNQTGENLTYKPLRLMDEPEIMKSMQDLWIEQGKTKADVYVAKFEKIGEINFNYADGVSKFIEKGSEPDFVNDNKFKENPYLETSLPQIDGESKKELETYIKSSIDLEGVIKDVVLNIVKDTLKNSESNSYLPDNLNTNVNENNSNQKNYTMKEIVESDEYEKIILPEKLNESINSGDKSMLVNENEEVQVWFCDGINYLTPVNRISKDKGYVKK